MQPLPLLLLLFSPAAASWLPQASMPVLSPHGHSSARAAPPVKDRPWMDSTLSPDKRTALLLAVMTIEEKVAQLGYGGCGSINDTVRGNPLGVGGCGVVAPPPVGPPPPTGKCEATPPLGYSYIGDGFCTGPHGRPQY